jgi:hypothetical protein
MKCHNAFTGETLDMPSAMTIDQMRRRPTHKGSEGYWIVSDAQLARDLRPRKLSDVYRENKIGRERVDYPTPVARNFNVDLAKYEAWCESIGHTPHPASIDPDHELNKWRERCPPRETVKEDAPMKTKEILQRVVKKIAISAEIVREVPRAPSIDYARAVLRRLEETADLEPESLERREAIQAARAIVQPEATP